MKVYGLRAKETVAHTQHNLSCLPPFLLCVCSQEVEIRDFCFSPSTLQSLSHYALGALSLRVREDLAEQDEAARVMR